MNIECDNDENMADINAKQVLNKKKVVLKTNFKPGKKQYTEPNLVFVRMHTTKLSSDTILCKFTPIN